MIATITCLRQIHRRLAIRVLSHRKRTCIARLKALSYNAIEHVLQGVEGQWVRQLCESLISLWPSYRISKFTIEFILSNNQA